jgi:replicative superfamily II helicase
VPEGSCAVVTAPTSSGKTFISSYCIQQVLKPEASAAAAAAAAAGPSGTTDSSRSSNKGKLDRWLSKGSKDVAGAEPQRQSGQQLATVAAAACAGPTSEGVVVIVLPTKALVNQLAAQVGAHKLASR